MSVHQHEGREQEDLGDRLRAALVGRYAIERLMAVGGMATVYQAHDLRHEREVAIKVLHPDLSATLAVERFLREIKIAARLRHPHILPLYDSGEAGELLFYVMPVERESLRDRLDRDTALPLDEVLRVADQILDALAYAHEQGVVHRDIKPENILFSQGHAIVADFGIARALGAAASDRVTRAGLALGTPDYMSPEQLVGDPHVDARSDVYSVACVLYETLLGRKPDRGFQKEFGTVTRAVIPPGIRAVVDRAWAVDRADRYPTATAFAEALRAFHPGSNAVNAADPARANSVAVLAFANMSADAEDEYFSDGITDEIINALARIDGLHVAARTSSFAFKHQTVDVATVGAQLGVATILEGSVRRVGNRVRILAQLIDVSNGYHVWSERYDRDMGDIFAIQDEIADAIAERLTVTLTERSRTRRAENFAAYTLYLKGRHMWNRRTAEGLEQAVNFFSESMALDPDYAPAYAGLADACMLLGSYGHMDPLEALSKAKAATQQALALDGTLAEAHATLGQVLRFELNWESEERAYRRAIELNPSYATAHQWYATLLTALGRLDEARSEITRAEELDPLSHAIGVTGGIVAVLSGAYDDAESRLKKALELAPDFFSAYAWLSLVYQLQGRNEDALRAAEATRALNENVGRLQLAVVNAMAGRRHKALRYLEEAEEQQPQNVLGAAVYAVLGDIDEAFARLDSAFHEDGWSFFALQRSLLFYINIGPWFGSLRGDPRFRDVLARMRFL